MHPASWLTLPGCPPAHSTAPASSNSAPAYAPTQCARLVHPPLTTPYRKPRPPSLSESLDNLEDEIVAVLMPEQTANKLALQVKTKA